MRGRVGELEIRWGSGKAYGFKNINYEQRVSHLNSKETMKIKHNMTTAIKH